MKAIGFILIVFFCTALHQADSKEELAFRVREHEVWVYPKNNPVYTGHYAPKIHIGWPDWSEAELSRLQKLGNEISKQVFTSDGIQSIMRYDPKKDSSRAYLLFNWEKKVVDVSFCLRKEEMHLYTEEKLQKYIALWKGRQADYTYVLREDLSIPEKERMTVMYVDMYDFSLDE